VSSTLLAIISRVMLKCLIGCAAGKFAVGKKVNQVDCNDKLTRHPIFPTVIDFLQPLLKLNLVQILHPSFCDRKS